MAQCGKFPIRYIIELLNKQRRIVLTGTEYLVFLNPLHCSYNNIVDLYIIVHEFD